MSPPAWPRWPRSSAKAVGRSMWRRRGSASALTSLSGTWEVVPARFHSHEVGGSAVFAGEARFHTADTDSEVFQAGAWAQLAQGPEDPMKLSLVRVALPGLLLWIAAAGCGQAEPIASCVL